jgi:O-methyltransferase
MRAERTDTLKPLRDLYNQLATVLTDPGFIFFNFGFYQPGAPPCDDLAEAHRHYKYSFNLVRHVLGDTPIAGKKVLEVGCGRGGNCIQLSRYSLAAEVVGLDLCFGNAVLCTRYHADTGLRFLAGDSQSLPFADGSFDVVLNLESSHCYPDFGSFLAEVRRVLRPGGIFCWADLWGPQHVAYDWTARAEALAAVDLELLAEEDISEPVFQALKQKDGLARILSSMVSPENRRLIELVNHNHELFRLQLAIGKSSYLLRRMHRRRLDGEEPRTSRRPSCSQAVLIPMR